MPTATQYAADLSAHGVDVARPSVVRALQARVMRDRLNATIADTAAHVGPEAIIAAIRALSHEVSWSRGVDLIDEGLALIEADLRDQDVALHGDEVRS